MFSALAVQILGMPMGKLISWLRALMLFTVHGSSRFLQQVLRGVDLLSAIRGLHLIQDPTISWFEMDLPDCVNRRAEDNARVLLWQAFAKQ